MEICRRHAVDSSVKTAMDYGLGAMALLLTFPLFLLIAAAIRFDSPGPVIYRRRVAGRGGALFDAYKFRTMVAEGEALLAQHPEWALENRGGQKLHDDPRVTRVGRFLRRYSLNELPQLVNVMRGQMSLVGPRMVTLAELVGHDDWRDTLMRIKPGLTGLWQVSGRDDLPLLERIRLDRTYVERGNIWMDIRILLKTFSVVVRGKSAY